VSRAGKVQGGDPLWLPSSICSRQRHRETAASVLVRFILGLGAAREGIAVVVMTARRSGAFRSHVETQPAKVDRSNPRMWRRFESVHGRYAPLPDRLYFSGYFWKPHSRIASESAPLRTAFWR
jgi:hypothetical protein